MCRLPSALQQQTTFYGERGIALSLGASLFLWGIMKGCSFPHFGAGRYQGLATEGIIKISRLIGEAILLTDLIIVSCLFEISECTFYPFIHLFPFVSSPFYSLHWFCAAVHGVYFPFICTYCTKMSSTGQSYGTSKANGTVTCIL